MALVHCRTCGHRVSTTAPKCPGCGTPPAQPADNAVASSWEGITNAIGLRRPKARVGSKSVSAWKRFGICIGVVMLVGLLISQRKSDTSVEYYLEGTSDLEVSDVEFSWAGDLDECNAAPGAPIEIGASAPEIYAQVSYIVRNTSSKTIVIFPALQVWEPDDEEIANLKLEGGPIPVSLQPGRYYHGTIVTQRKSPGMLRGPGKFTLSRFFYWGSRKPPNARLAGEKYSAGPCLVAEKPDTRPPSAATEEK